MESGAKGRAREEAGEKEVIRPAPFALLQFRLSSLCQAEIRSCGFTAPRFRMCVRYVLHSTSLSQAGTRRAKGGSHKSGRGSRPRAAGCQIAASILSKTEHGLKYRASIHSTAAIQNGRGGAFSRTKEEEEETYRS